MYSYYCDFKHKNLLLNVLITVNLFGALNVICNNNCEVCILLCLV